MTDLHSCDKITETICSIIKARAEIGLKKYGITVSERKDLSLQDWVIHLQEELMDSIVYLEKIKNEL